MEIPRHAVEWPMKISAPQQRQRIEGNGFND
jgi:hypothetical protein